MSLRAMIDSHCNTLTQARFGRFLEWGEYAPIVWKCAVAFNYMHPLVSSPHSLKPRWWLGSKGAFQKSELAGRNIAGPHIMVMK